jgi:hypothetical protein
MPFSGDLRLPYADDFSQLNPPRPPPSAPVYVTVSESYGRMPCRCQWLIPSGSFGGQMNSLTYGLRIRTQDLKVAIPYILGFATSAGTFLNRELPIQDPDGFGMSATGVSIRGYQGPSGKIKLEIPTSTGEVNGPAPGDGRIYDSTYTDFFDTTLAVTSVASTQRVADLFRYVILNVTFEHVQYWRASDNIITGDQNGERDRFLIWNYIPAIEYVALDSNVIYWTETGPAGPIPFRQTVGRGAGFVRSIGELKGTWYGIPADTVYVLLQKWLGMGGYPTTQPVQGVTGYPISGRINAEPFTVDITNFNGYITCPSETLLFQPPKIQIVPNPMGFRNYNVEFSISVRPETWNRFLHWPTGAYYRCMYLGQAPPVGTDPDPSLFRPIYGTANFEEAFRG